MKEAFHLSLVQLKKESLMKKMVKLFHSFCFDQMKLERLDQELIEIVKVSMTHSLNLMNIVNGC